jgi:hypothetical protein
MTLRVVSQSSHLREAGEGDPLCGGSVIGRHGLTGAPRRPEVDQGVVIPHRPRLVGDNRIDDFEKVRLIDFDSRFLLHFARRRRPDRFPDVLGASRKAPFPGTGWFPPADEQDRLVPEYDNANPDERARRVLP